MISKIKIQKLIEKWKKKLFLDGYTVTYKIGTMVEIEKHEKKYGIENSRAYSSMGYPLRQIHILFNPKYVNNIERTIVHELLHCITEPLRQTIVSIAGEYIDDDKIWNILLSAINARTDELIEQLTESLY